ncbi:MAG: transposase [Endomicrobium sp.]|jgi:transposase-like protein|nr:transposase [Endomicrobium sp.]
MKEMKEILGFGKTENKEGGRENYRNGTYSKKVKNKEVGMEMEVPRDRIGEYEPKIAEKEQWDIFGIEDKIISFFIIPTPKDSFIIIAFSISSA